jgi:UDP-N-acetylmuramoylalanine--D-glutamate ligase
VREGISYLENLEPLEHRFEFVASKDGIDFCNDSKSTTMQSTIAAINEFKNTNVFLLVGGLSKGVNRAPLFEEIKNKVSFISCFGGESEQLSQLCFINKIPHSKHANLTDAFQVIVKEAQKTKSSVVLFSPAGSSYDLFKNYEDRGLAFKKLVLCLLSN